MNELKEGSEIEFAIEPIDGMGKVFTYEYTFTIDDEVMHSIKKGVFNYTLTEEKFRKCLGENYEEKK